MVHIKIIPQTHQSTGDGRSTKTEDIVIVHPQPAVALRPVASWINERRDSHHYNRDAVRYARIPLNPPAVGV